MTNGVANNNERIERSTLQQILNLLVGILGFILPAALYVISDVSDLRGPMSSYYHTDAKWVFIGYLLVLGILLLVYRNYETVDFIAALLLIGILIVITIWCNIPLSQEVLSKNTLVMFL